MYVIGGTVALGLGYVPLLLCTKKILDKLRELEATQQRWAGMRSKIAETRFLIKAVIIQVFLQDPFVFSPHFLPCIVL